LNQNVEWQKCNNTVLASLNSVVLESLTVRVSIVKNCVDLELAHLSYTSNFL